MDHQWDYCTHHATARHLKERNGVAWNVVYGTVARQFIVAGLAASAAP
ncbi:MAG: hypothetical protein LC793_15575 [Thermomicrobia bacterium]|nr:hypothetical protein [Thermomicrobia bacterium]MCA1723465.1 hypothetical protein [Thermomicrobia bacterium]